MSFSFQDSIAESTATTAAAGNQMEEKEEKKAHPMMVALT